MAMKPVNPGDAIAMAETGPFRIDGQDYETSAGGQITRTTPAVAAIVENPRRALIIRRRARKVVERDNLTAQITELTAQRDQLNTDITNYQTIIDNST